jgi:hypothetical protein
MATLQLNVSDDLEVERLAKEAGFETAGAYVESLVRADRMKRELERLEALALEGLESGPAVRTTDAYWNELRAEAERRFAQVDRTTSPE